jgi:PAS domain S-box-containing protein
MRTSAGEPQVTIGRAVDRSATALPPSGGLPAYDELPDAVLVITADETLLAVNTAAAGLLGVDRREAIGRRLGDVADLQDERGRSWWACTDGARELPRVTRAPERTLLLVAGGRERSVTATARYVRSPTGTLLHTVLCLRDASARERSERDQADLVSTVAHELRSPLTSVKGFTATLLAKWDRFDDQQKQHMLATVNGDADRVTRLLSELLDVSRIDAGRLELHRQVVDVASAVQRIVDGRLAAGDEPTRFVVLRGEEPPEMWVDADKLDQVLGNLLENAVRHGAGTVTVTVGRRGDGAEIVVDDEGDGIPEDGRTRVFRRFWRGPGGRRGGTGLGLYIVKGLVDAHGGTVTVGSSPAGGARFDVWLPAGTPDFAR